MTAGKAIKLIKEKEKLIKLIKNDNERIRKLL